MKLQSDFALLDVKKGRKALSKLIPPGSNKTNSVIATPSHLPAGPRQNKGAARNRQFAHISRYPI